MRLHGRAVELDLEGNYDSAIETYQRCVSIWDAMCVNEANPQIKLKIEAKSLELLKRIAALKNFCMERMMSPPQSRPTTSTSIGSVSGRRCWATPPTNTTFSCQHKSRLHASPPGPQSGPSYAGSSKGWASLYADLRAVAASDTRRRADGSLQPSKEEKRKEGTEMKDLKDGKDERGGKEKRRGGSAGVSGNKFTFEEECNLCCRSLDNIRAYPDLNFSDLEHDHDCAHDHDHNHSHDHEYNRGGEGDAGPPQGKNDGGGMGGGKACENTSPMELYKQQIIETSITEVPKVTFDDVVGLEDAKQAIQEAVIFPRKFALFLSGQRPWNAILLYGPPGTGKTLLARATAHAFEASYLQISSSDILSKWQGESEKLVKALFELAKERHPCVLFVDEVDALCCARGSNDTESTRRVKTEFLVQLSQLATDAVVDILVLAATNMPWDLDSAILRRFQRRVYIDIPNREARQRCFEKRLESVRHRLSQEELRRLGELSEGMTAHDIEIVVRDAVLEPIRQLQSASHFHPVLVEGKHKFQPVDKSATRRCPWHGDCGEGKFEKIDLHAIPLHFDDLDPSDIDLEPVSMEHFIKILGRNRQTVSKESLRAFHNWTESMGMKG